MSEKTYQLQTLSRALDVLTLIEISPEPMTLTAIADRMGEAAPVIFRILKTLEAKNFISRIGDSKQYGLSEAHDRLAMARLVVRVLHALSGQPPQSAARLADGLQADLPSTELALRLIRESRLAVVNGDGEWLLSPYLPELARSRSIAELVEAVRPVMARLQEETGETIAFFLRNGASQVALQVLTSHHPLRYTVEVGAIFPVSRGAAGKASLAWLPESQVRELLDDPSLAGETLDRPRLFDTLRETRKRGYATSFGERISGAAAVSMPVIDESGEVRGVMNVTGPESRFSPEVIEAHGLALRRELTAAGLFQEPPGAADIIAEETRR